jgi:3-oxoacyl-[acyl-carrier protein] reductase
MVNYLDLSGRVALITGGSSGIGAATARTFAQLGAAIAIGFYRNREGAFQVRDEVAKTGAKIIALAANLEEPDRGRALIRETENLLGPIDILVNNAGSLIERKPILEMSDETWSSVMRLNLDSAFVCARAAAPSMPG